MIIHGVRGHFRTFYLLDHGLGAGDYIPFMAVSPFSIAIFPLSIIFYILFTHFSHLTDRRNQKTA